MCLTRDVSYSKNDSNMMTIKWDNGMETNIWWPGAFFDYHFTATCNNKTDREIEKAILEEKIPFRSKFTKKFEEEIQKTAEENPTLEYIRYGLGTEHEGGFWQVKQ